MVTKEARQLREDVTEQAGAARQDIGEQYREAQLALKAERLRGRQSIEREAGKARSGVEKESQEALGEVREKVAKLARKGDLPGYGVARTLAKKSGGEAIGGITQATVEANMAIDEARAEGFKDLSKWYTGESGKLAKSKEEAEKQIYQWEEQALQAVTAWASQMNALEQQLREVERQARQAKAEAEIKAKQYTFTYDQLKAALLNDYMEHGNFSKNRVMDQIAPDLTGSDRFALRSALLHIQVQLEHDKGTKYFLDRLEPYKTGGGYDVVKALASGDEYVRGAVYTLFSDEQIKSALESRPTIDVGQWVDLSENDRLLYRPVMGLTMDAYLGVPEIEKKNFYVKPIEVPAAVYAKLGEKARANAIPRLSFWEGLTPWKEELGEKATFAGAATMAAEVAVPGAYMARHWKDMKPWEKGVGIAVDMASLIPGLTYASALRRAGTSTVKSIGKTTLAELQAPITSVLHPIESAKSIIYPAETVIRPGKLPLTALEIRYSTVKIPVRQIGSPVDAMAARDTLVARALRGTGATVEVGGRELALTPTALQEVLQGVAVHTTPDLRAFLGGAKIGQGREGGLFVSPTLHSKFSVASAFGDMPKGGMPGAVIITDKKILARLQPTRKIYRGAVEVESLLKTGETLPAPSQILFTRAAMGAKASAREIRRVEDGIRKAREMGRWDEVEELTAKLKKMKEYDVPAGQRLSLAVIGPPLSTKQIAQLKLLGAKDLIRDIFAPSWKAKGLTRNLDELADLGKQTKKLERELAAAKKARDTAKVNTLESRIKELNRRSARISERVDREALSHTPLRPMALGYGRLLGERLFTEYAERDPVGFARVVRRMNTEGRQRVYTALEPRLARSFRVRVERLPRDVRAPQVYSAISRVEVPRDSKLTRTAPPPRTPPRSRVPPPEREFPPPDIPPPPEQPLPPTVPKLSKGEDEAGRRMPMGSICWKQGLFYITLKPPYRGKKDMVWTRKAPSGVKMIEGPGSARKTITKLGVNVPEKALLDLGIMDVEIARHGSRIKFRRDVRQRTRLGYPVGMPAGVVGLKER